MGEKVWVRAFLRREKCEVVGERVRPTLCWQQEVISQCAKISQTADGSRKF